MDLRQAAQPRNSHGAVACTKSDPYSQPWPARAQSVFHSWAISVPTRVIILSRRSLRIYCGTLMTSPCWCTIPTPIGCPTFKSYARAGTQARAIDDRRARCKRCHVARTTGDVGPDRLPIWHRRLFLASFGDRCRGARLRHSDGRARKHGAVANASGFRHTRHTFSEDSSASVLTAIRSALANFDDIARRAANAAKSWAESQGPRGCVDALLRISDVAANE